MENIFYDRLSKSSMDILKFLLIQDPVKLAIGVVFGMAISRVFLAFITDIISPLLTGLLRTVSSTGFNYNINGAEFKFGNTIEQIVAFIIICCLLYYLVVLPINKLKVKYNIEQRTTPCMYCKTLINPLATRCPNCTSELNELN